MKYPFRCFLQLTVIFYDVHCMLFKLSAVLIQNLLERCLSWVMKCAVAIFEYEHH